MTGVAWQKQRRDALAQTEASGNLFGTWWDGIDIDIRKALVREVDYRTAAAIIEKYEWMGCMPAIVWNSYGIFFDGECGGVVTYGSEYAENLGKWDKFGFTGKITVLSRGACVHWAHPHAGSKLIRASMRMLPPRFEVVTATVDRAAGEIGTIYQACGFDYVGIMSAHKSDVTAYRIRGKLVTELTLRHAIGSAARDVVLAHYPDAEWVPQPRKGRYFAFRGDRETKHRNRAAIAHLIEPYPKRSCAESIDGDAAGCHPDEGGSIPTSALREGL